MRNIKRLGILSAPVLLAAESANAALTTEEAAVFTDVTTKFTDVTAAGFTLLALVLGTMIGWKVIKKVVNKAT